jgi:histidinol phosphatase-like PHP family hydrolase
MRSRNSCDSESTLDEICQGAVRNGVRIVCFTEHVDLNPRDEGYGYFQILNDSTDAHYVNSIRQRSDRP